MYILITLIICILFIPIFYTHKLVNKIQSHELAPVRRLFQLLHGILCHILFVHLAKNARTQPGHKVAADPASRCYKSRIFNGRWP